MKTTTFIPLDGPKLPPGYAHFDREPSAADVEYRAYKHGRKMEMGAPQCWNPYKAGTPEHLAFHNGWHAARAQREAVYELRALQREGVQVILQKSVRGHLKRQLFKKREPA